MDLNPSDIQARSRYVRFLAASLRVDEGLRLARESLAIDPLSNEMHSVIGSMLYYAGRFQESIDYYLERRGTSTGGHIGLGRSYAAAGMFPEAIAELRAAYQRSENDPSTLAELGRTLAASGNVDEARRILDELERMPAGRFPHVSPQDRAYIYVALGDHDTAIRLLNDAVTAQESRLLWLGVDPRVRSLRADPRFVSILRRLGIPVS